MTKHAFPAYAFKKKYLRRHLIKPRSMILHSVICRLQEMNTYLADFTPNTTGQKLHLYLQMKSWTSSAIPSIIFSIFDFQI